MKAVYVFVNWETRDVVSTYSRPYAYHSEYVHEEQGRKAKQLIADGYSYVGYYSGINSTTIKKEATDE